MKRGMFESPRPTVSRIEIAVAAVGLTLLAVMAPAPLYVVAVSAFSLPHVLWEMAWLRQTLAGRLPAAWWLCAGAVVLLQAAARLGSWRGWLDASAAVTLDMFTLAALALTVVLARRLLVRPWLTLGSAVLMAGGLIAAVYADAVFSTLALLSIAHNFTPLALAPAGATLSRHPLRPMLLALFALPCGLILMTLAVGWLGAPVSNAAPDFGIYQPSELRWLAQFDARIASLLPALVLAQCLHYYSVIRLLPQSLGPGEWRMDFKGAAVLGSAALAAYFALDFKDARGLYAIAAGAHAWIEWPVMLLVMGGARAQRG